MSRLATGRAFRKAQFHEGAYLKMDTPWKWAFSEGRQRGVFVKGLRMGWVRIPGAVGH